MAQQYRDARRGPQWSADGRWWWDGMQWIPAMPPAQAPVRGTSLDVRKVLSVVQMGLAFVVAVLTLLAPYGAYRYRSGYLDASGRSYYVPKTFAVFAGENASTILLTFFVVAVAAGLAFAAYMWAWNPASRADRRYPMLTVGLAAAQLMLGLLAVADVAFIAAGNATRTGFQTSSWWLGAATYGVLVGAVACLGIGLVALLMVTRRAARGAIVPMPRAR